MLLPDLPVTVNSRLLSSAVPLTLVRMTRSPLTKALPGAVTTVVEPVTMLVMHYCTSQITPRSLKNRM
jgi:hypothetical protein